MSAWGKLSQQTKEDLLEWINICKPDEDVKEALARLFLSGKFQAWDCPECGERVYNGQPDDWGDFQGVLQQDFSSYPGNEGKYTPGYLEKMCDDCRCHG